MDLGLGYVWLVLDQVEIHIMIFRFAAYAESPSPETGEQHTNEFPEAGRVEDSDSLRRTARCVVSIDSPTWHRAFAPGANGIYPMQVSNTVTGRLVRQVGVSIP